jgi:hypothetical protein
MIGEGSQSTVADTCDGNERAATKEKKEQTKRKPVVRVNFMTTLFK